MNPISIIDKYYQEGDLRTLLILHSGKVAQKALTAIRNSGLYFDEELLFAGAMIHDIGIFLCDAPSIFCFGSEPYIRHGLLGGELLQKEGYPKLARFCERHTGAGLTAEDIIRQNLPLPHLDMLPESLEEKAVCYADKFFSKSGNPSQEKTLDKVMSSMQHHGDDTFHRFMEMHKIFRGY